jgi:hypothetical protein
VGSVAQVAVLFAREGADVAILYLDEHEDAADTRKFVEAEGRAPCASPATSAAAISASAPCNRWSTPSAGSIS